jgi:hypothetical protein
VASGRWDSLFLIYPLNLLYLIFFDLLLSPTRNRPTIGTALPDGEMAMLWESGIILRTREEKKIKRRGLSRQD